MRVVHISSSDTGGAGRAAYRLHCGLRRIGVDSKLYVPSPTREDDSITPYNEPNSFFFRLGRKFRRHRWGKELAVIEQNPDDRYEYFSTDIHAFGSEVIEQVPEADVINLHWVTCFLPLDQFFSSNSVATPVFWTLHDMNPFTGGCHFSNGCERFAEACGTCPQLRSQEEDDQSRLSWTRKSKAYGKLTNRDLNIVTPSQWLARKSMQSSLLGHQKTNVIPYGVETEVFAPSDRAEARARFGIPADAKVVLFCAESVANPRKGMRHLLSALAKLQDIPNLILVSIGGGESLKNSSGKSMHLGRLTKDEDMAAAYGAADIYVIPSIEDNLPNTILEAMACGTPVIGFDIGGIPDLVKNSQTGQVVPAFDEEALAKGIREMLADTLRLAEMRVTCRKTILSEYSLEAQARRYVKLYQEVIDQRKLMRG
jgi:glycosyltransferase involved in cell wall biosynthesis